MYDVNGDKLTDIVTSLAAHDFGLAWFEQKKAADGSVTFEEHMIADDFSTKNAGDVVFSEPHASRFADMNGDKIPDFIVGKRYWSHLENYNGPDPYGPAVVYIYRTVRNPKAPGGAEFVPELVHNRSGVGSTFEVADLNKDGTSRHRRRRRLRHARVLEQACGARARGEIETGKPGFLGPPGNPVSLRLEPSAYR